jgi:hypothetical protein
MERIATAAGPERVTDAGDGPCPAHPGVQHLLRTSGSQMGAADLMTIELGFVEDDDPEFVAAFLSRHSVSRPATST